MKFLPNLKEGYIPPSTSLWWGPEMQPPLHFLNSKSIFLNSLAITWSNRINNSCQDLKNNWMTGLGENASDSTVMIVMIIWGQEKLM